MALPFDEEKPDTKPNPPNPQVTESPRGWDWVYQQCTFFRLHLTAFVLIPLVMSGIFYACNGRFKIKFLDSLFLCYSAMTGTGLATRNLSTLTPFQQVQLWLLMAFGTQTTVSWIMVLTRRYYIRTKCTYVYWNRRLPTRQEIAIAGGISSPRDLRRHSQQMGAGPDIEITGPTPKSTPHPSRKATVSNTDPQIEKEPPSDGYPFFDRGVVSSSPKSLDVDLPTDSSISQYNPWQEAMNPTQSLRKRGMTLTSMQHGPFTSRLPGIEEKYQGFGGFPGPFQVVQKIAKRFAPSTYRKLERSMTLPSTTTLDMNGSSIRSGRNSNFRTETLSETELEEIGGVEYRAVNLLCYLIPIYFVVVQLISFLIFAPWLASTKKYNHVFEAQPRLVSKPWFALFLTMSAYSGTGLDLVDTAMLPFQEAYPMIFGIMFTLLAGNHAQPIILRFIIWLGSLFTAKDSELDQTLRFLLEHPRRHALIFIFPSAQTWFLCIVLCCLSAVEWSAFGILNLGLPVLTQLPMGARVVVGLFQGIAVRASGLTIVVIGALAPAMQFLYIVLMYIAVYPVAMCIRATNVYEEQSLGIFESEEGELQDNLGALELREGVGRYLGWHLRQQISIDIWWLVWGIFAVAIIERGNIMNPDKPYFSMFPLIFELVSAFAGVGMSLGFPDDNYSLVGTMSPLSRIVIIIIMIRGRHRGLPVAVDRAVLLPSELVTDHKSRTLPKINTQAGDVEEIPMMDGSTLNNSVTQRPVH
ncbi:potassium transporter [Lyophyllum atratum]|nr:potassium transporter [Lyophyllum atratum]